jgi:hypothetical protein
LLLTPTRPLPLAGAGREQLAAQLLQRYPQRFTPPRRVTDRKPGKGEKDAAAAADVDFIKADVLAKLASQGQLVWSQHDAAAGGTTAVTAEAVSSILSAGACVLLDLNTLNWALCVVAAACTVSFES